MPSRSATGLRVTLFVTEHDADPSFAATVAAGALRPCLLDADNLHDAAVQTGRLHSDASSTSPLTLLRIDTTAPPPVAHTSGRCAHSVPPGRTIAFPDSPRLLAGLIADAVRVGVADGAVIGVAGEPPTAHRVRAEVAAHLEQAGFDVAFDIPGWVLDDERVSLSG
ncbi:hypothetical protein GCM10023094_51750 [Rhodococcus olei]|uniref:Uncharacterized protein n=1 Tax=Rhodococcus olei TaxID=2161675 RepID=A0ABP8PQH7_9NOCA